MRLHSRSRARAGRTLGLLVALGCQTLPTAGVAAQAAASAAPAEPAAVDWAASARADLQFAGSAMAGMHAGVAAGIPSVTVPLDVGLRTGLAQAPAVRSELDYRRLMARFIAGFGDPHTGIDLHLSQRGWTGLVLDRRDGRYRVAWSEPGWPNALPPRGAEVQSCDGVWFGTYLQTALAPLVNSSVEYAGTYAYLARQSMFDTGLGWTPKACVFVLADGSRKTYALPLRGLGEPADRARARAALRSVEAGATPAGMAPIGPGKTWIGMPDFSGTHSGPAYEALYPRLASLAQSGWVVFDLRGNGGGDSSWGNRALAALFGRALAERLAQAGGAEEYMVASPNTVAVLRRYLSLPQFAATKNENEAALRRVEAALARGDRMALVDGEAGAGERPPVLNTRPHGPRIAALIDRGCFSSCMNFLQQIRALDDSVVLGEPTLGYSPFGEISQVPLPSGQGALYIPTALFKTAQATREPFVPDLGFDGNFDGNRADDAQVRRWVAAMLDRIDAGAVPGIKASSVTASPVTASSGRRGSRP